MDTETLAKEIEAIKKEVPEDQLLLFLLLRLCHAVEQLGTTTRRIQ